jgi:hypothetical protein
LVAGSVKGQIVLFDVSKKDAPSRELGKVKSVGTAVFLSHRVLVGDSEGALHVWNLFKLPK